MAMKVVMVGPFGLRPRGTMSRRALPLAKELAARGHQVRVILPPWDCPEDSERVWDEDGVQVHNVSLPASAPLYKDISIAARLVAQVLRERPDVVHLFKPKGYSGLAAAILWYLRRLGFGEARLVLDADDWEGPGGWNDRLPYPRYKRRFFVWQERWGMTHCQALTVASRELGRLAQDMGVAQDRVFHLPNGVDPSNGHRGGDFAPRIRSQWFLDEDPVVLLYTRFFEFRPERLARVLSRVLGQEPSVHFLVVGKGLCGEEESFLSLVGEEGLGRSIVYAGWQEGDDLRGCFAAADIAICPLEDSLLNRARCPAKLVDLMAAGLPIVAEKVGEVGLYLEHLSSGYLVPPGDEGAFVAGIVGLLRDEPLRAALGTTARQRAQQQFSWPRLVGVLESAYAR